MLLIQKNIFTSKLLPMTKKLFPNRCALILLKRGFCLLLIAFSAYLCLTYVMAPLLQNGLGSSGSGSGSKRSSESLFTFRSASIRTTSRYDPEVPARESPDQLLGAKSSNSHRPSDDIPMLRKGVIGILKKGQQQQQQKFLDVLNLDGNGHAASLSSSDDDDDTENSTRIINGRLVRIGELVAPALAKPSRRVVLVVHQGSDNGSDKRQITGSKSSSVSCPEPSPYLMGRLKETTLLMTTLKESDVIKMHQDLKPGGEWKPDGCQSKYKVAIVVPFRDRQSHLTRLIDFLVPILKRQLLDFRFIVTEQYGGDLFNKGRIMNAAFEFADEKLKVDCVIFHDVDLFPQDDRNFYGCPSEPRHIGAYVNTLGYVLWYHYLVGGVLSIQAEHYKQINGYSNMYWAWGGEDDDIGLRILANNFTIERPEIEFGQMTMLKHMKRQKTAPNRVKDLLKDAGTRWPTEGYNQSAWHVVKVQVTPLYFHLYVDVGPVPDEWRSDYATTGKSEKLANRAPDIIVN